MYMLFLRRVYIIQREARNLSKEEVFKKMVEDALAAQWADVKTIKEKRGGPFVIEDAAPYVDAVKKMEAVGEEEPTVIALHKESVIAHYEILKGLTKTIRPEDDPFVEHYQTPPILEILYEEDPKFKEAMDKFIDQIGRSEALISRECIRRYGGFYGPTCVVDFAFVPGSTSNVVNQILTKTDIDLDYKKTILAAKSWGMNTSYGIGAAFVEAIEAGKTASEAVAEEIEWLKKIYATPSAAQAELMDKAGHTSFDVRKYMSQYKDRIKGTVKKAIDAGVHYGNIVVVPAYCVGDVGHHIAQSMFNMCKDDVVMGVIEAVTQVLDSTLRAGLRTGYKDEFAVLRTATGSTAAAAAYILEKDGFTASMVTDLLFKRYYSFVNMNPARGAAAELHNVDFMDMINRGAKLIDPIHLGKKAKVAGIEIDLSPVDDHEVLANPQRYTYPACAITVRFSALMRLADFPCLLTSEPVTATLGTHATALHPDTPFAPLRARKFCAVTSMMPSRCTYCQWYKAV